MTMLVSVDQARKRARILPSAEQDDLILMIEGASAAVLNYLKIGPEAYGDSNGEISLDSNENPVGVPAVVQNAVVCLVGIWYRDPDGAEQDKWRAGFLPAPVTAILYPLRDPTMA